MFVCMQEIKRVRARGRRRDLRSKRHVDSVVVICDSSNQLFFQRNRLSFFVSLFVVKDHLLLVINKAI